MKKLKNIILLTFVTIISMSCSMFYIDDALEIRKQMEIEKAKSRTVYVINGNDTILNFDTTSDTIIIKLNY